MILEHDLEQLELLLDGELAVEQADLIRQRLSSDPQLSQAMDQLRSQRDARQQMWRTLEPREAQAAALADRVRAAIRNDQAWTSRLRALRYVSGLAACILLGFIFGRYMQWDMSGSSAERGNGVLVEPRRGTVIEVMDDKAVRPQPGEFKVLLTDSAGRVIAEQRFSTLDEAREFTDDLNRLHSGTRPMRVSDTIFKKEQF